jgi:hypothetical protein
MIHRDSLGFPGQHDLNDPTYLDFGDSDFKAAMFSIGGSTWDKDLIEAFVVKDQLVRHPNDPKWKDPKLTSRDQLIAYISALYFCKKFELAAILAGQYYWHINKDIFAPDLQWHKQVCAGNPKTFWRFIGRPWLLISIVWSTKIKPDHELNQILCQCMVAGKEFVTMLCVLHPDWKKNLRDYWGNWRDNAEVGEALIKKIQADFHAV